MNSLSTEAIHIPIMSEEVVTHLVTNRSGFYVDATFGDGGHTAALLAQISSPGHLLALDRDPAAVERGKQLFVEEIRQGKLDIKHVRFSQIEEEVKELKDRPCGILMDIGVSSRQLDIAERGFSFQQSGPLDMRMDTSEGEPLRNHLAKMDEKTLAKILLDFGEEPRTMKLARAILAKKNILKETKDLAEAIAEVMPAHRRHGRIHPATRVFAALRIFINDELNELKKGLNASLNILAPEGRIAVIAFHALEHRIVKDFVRSNALVKNLAKCMTTQEEIRKNPRSRSAVLRIMKKQAA